MGGRAQMKSSGRGGKRGARRSVPGGDSASFEACIPLSAADTPCYTVTTYMWRGFQRIRNRDILFGCHGLNYTGSRAGLRL